MAGLACIPECVRSLRAAVAVADLLRSHCWANGTLSFAVNRDKLIGYLSLTTKRRKKKTNYYYVFYLLPCTPHLPNSKDDSVFSDFCCSNASYFCGHGKCFCHHIMFPMRTSQIALTWSIINFRIYYVGAVVICRLVAVSPFKFMCMTLFLPITRNRAYQRQTGQREHIHTISSTCDKFVKH